MSLMGRKRSSEAHDNEPNGNETHLQQKTTTTSTMACRLQLLNNIKELRFVFCQSSPASSSARYPSFIFLLLELLPLITQLRGSVLSISLWKRNFCTSRVFFRFLIESHFISGLSWRRTTRIWRRWTRSCPYWSESVYELSPSCGLDMVICQSIPSSVLIILTVIFCPSSFSSISLRDSAIAPKHYEAFLFQRSICTQMGPPYFILKLVPYL